MIGLVELFDMCDRTIQYKKVGNEVDYAFWEESEVVEGKVVKTLYIFFEPSDGKEDWRMNFSYWRKPYKDMKIGYRVHGGFLKCWKAVQDIVIEKVTEVDDDGNFIWDKVVVVGYSHGAALAALCHECVWYHRPDLRAQGLTGIGFDGPRIYAGFKVKRALEERWAHFTMYRNQNDIVTHLPPIVFGFAHVGKLIKIGEKQPKCSLIGAHYQDKIKAALRDYVNGRVEE